MNNNVLFLLVIQNGFNKMQNIINYFTDLGVSYGVAILYIVVSVLIVIMAIVALIMRIMVIIKYQQGNRMRTSEGKTSF